MYGSAAESLDAATAAYERAVSDPASAGVLVRQALDAAREGGHHEARAVALRAQAHLERLATHTSQALALLQEGLELAEREGLTSRQGELLVTRIAVLHEMGRLDDAQRDADRALDLVDAQALLDLVFQQAVLRHNERDLASARTAYEQVLDRAESALLRAKAANNLAHMLVELGDVEAALSLLEKTDEFAAEAGPWADVFLSQTRALAEAVAGRPGKALVLFERAREALVRAGAQVGEHWIDRAEVLAGLNLLPEALDAVRQALAALPEDDLSLMAAEAHLRHARLCLTSGDGAGAREAVRRGVALLRKQGRPGWVALAEVLDAECAVAEGGGEIDLWRVHEAAGVLRESGLVSDAVNAFIFLGRCALAASREDLARSALRQAEELAAQGPVLLRVRGALATALACQVDGAATALLEACARGLADLAGHRDALPSVELRARASEHGAELGLLALTALRRAGADAGVLLTWLERTRAAALLPLDGVEDGRLERELADLRAAQAEVTAAAQEGSVPGAVLERVRLAETAVRQASWSDELAIRRSTELVDPVRLRAGLGSAVLVEHGLLDGQLFAVIVTATDQRVVELGAAQLIAELVDGALFGLRRLARRGAPAVSAAAATRGVTSSLGALRARLIEPLGLDPRAELVVVPVGDLQRVPWAPLHDGPVAVAPSAAAWLRTLQPRARTERVALIGGPGLPGVEAELAALTVVHQRAVIRVSSTCAEAVEALRGADLAHLACHGKLRTDNPAFSSLLLADGPLTVHELSRRAGTPGRVVLAACESGGQVLYPGDEALGFVSALLARGCRAVLASDVLVPDEPSLPLMVALHRALARGATMAQALHVARQVLDVEDPQQLATWCAFDAYGGG